MDIDKLNESAKEAIKAFPWLGGDMTVRDYKVATSLLGILLKGNDEDFVEEFDPLISVLIFSLGAYMDAEESKYYREKAAEPSTITQADIARFGELLKKKIIH